LLFLQFFGWGRKKDPPPLQNLQQSNKPGAVHSKHQNRTFIRALAD
jgi:hypothetical protein